VPFTIRANYESLYWLPEPVRTIVPALAPPRIGEVVISVPFRKLGELLTNPVSEPSAFCFHRDNTGILSFGAVFVAGVGFTETAAGLDVAGPPNKERDGRAAAAFAAGGALGTVGGAALEPPKNEKGLGAGAGAGAGWTFGAGLEPKRENDGFGAGAGAGGGVTLGSGFGLKNENDAGFGAGEGGGVTIFGAGFGLRNEKLGVSFLGGTGAGLRVTSALTGVDFFPPKKEENASLTGSLVSIVGIGFNFSSGFGSGALAFSGALKRLVKLIVARGAACFVAAAGVLAGGVGLGAGALATGTGFGAGAGLGMGLGVGICATTGLGTGADLVAGGDFGFERKSKLRVGRGAGAGAFVRGGFATGFLVASGALGEDPKKEPRLRLGRGAGAGAPALVLGDPKMEPNEKGRGDGFGTGAGSGALGESLACFASHSRAWALSLSAASSESCRCFSMRALAAASAAFAALIASAAASCRSFSISLS
jgi:hypothetical protein